MNDILHQLRLDADWNSRIEHNAARAELMMKAADEIERLRAMNQKLLERNAEHERKIAYPPGLS